MTENNNCDVTIVFPLLVRKRKDYKCFFHKEVTSKLTRKASWCSEAHVNKRTFSASPNLGPLIKHFHKND